MKKQLALFVTIIVILFSCGQSAKENAPSNETNVDSVAVSKVDTVSNVDELKGVVAGAESDFVASAPVMEPITKALPPIVTQNPQGTLVYYCPSRMLENTDNNVSVTITKAALHQAIDQLEKKVAATTGRSPESIQHDITGSSITIAAKMKVELKYGEKEFETIYKPENDDQIFDGTNDMNWDWIIKPMKVGPVQLSIIISAYDEKNGRWIAAQTPPKIFDIKVQVDPRGYFAKLWEFLETHPEWLFMQILFPLIAFFFGKKQGKKSE